MKQTIVAKIILLAICLVLIMSIPLLAQTRTENWRIAGYTKYRDAVFADTSRIASPSSDGKTIWIKIAPAARSRYSQMVNEYLAKVSKSGKGFKSIEILCEINCSSHLIRFARFVYFDNEGKIIHAVDENSPDRFSILPGDIWSNVEREACGAGK